MNLAASPCRVHLQFSIQYQRAGPARRHEIRHFRINGDYKRPVTFHLLTRAISNWESAP